MATKDQKGINPYANYGGPTVGPTVFSTHAHAPGTATVGTEKVAVATETYISEIYISVNATITGLALLNATAVAGNITLAIADSAGNILAQTASTAASGTAAFQQVPFITALAAKGPGKYFVLLQCNNTGQKFRTHAVGNAAAWKLTGQTYGTIPALTPVTTFTADVGPICQTY